MIGCDYGRFFKVTVAGGSYQEALLTHIQGVPSGIYNDGKVAFSGNNAGGITGGLSTGQDIVVRLSIKPTPTIAKDQNTIDKVSLEDVTLSAITWRDPTIVSRVWPVAEAFTAIVILDQYISNIAYQEMRRPYEK